MTLGVPGGTAASMGAALLLTAAAAASRAADGASPWGLFAQVAVYFLSRPLD